MGKKAYLVSWTTICTDKKGGLGIRSLSLLNRALLESGVGDMFLKGKSCGSKLKRGNMGRKEQASTLCEVGGGYGVGVWKAIRKGWNLFFSKTSFEVSNGRRVKFGPLDGVWRSLCVPLFPLCMLWLYQRKLRRWICWKT